MHKYYPSFNLQHLKKTTSHAVFCFFKKNKKLSGSQMYDAGLQEQMELRVPFLLKSFNPKFNHGCRIPV